ncbi:MAG: shikimate dehydrogenase [Anaerolineae bacterium]|nr:shikimate dehydrogenase [Anaerolineae bacterium]
MITAETKLVGVMGWPIAHSLSPAMHNAAFDALGMNWCYVAFAVQPGQVGAAVEGLKALGFCGCNVTVPHKEAVIPTLDHVPERVRRFGAVNTLIFDRDGDGRCMLTGENTDVQGLIRSLQRAGFESKGKKVLVVGAGGGARGTVYALCEAQVAEITVLNRTEARAHALVGDLTKTAQRTQLKAGALVPGRLIDCAREADLLVNTTSRGMWPHVDVSIWPDDESIPSHLAVCDLVYRPLETRLLHQARASGALAIDGLEMLVAQGALSFQMWTGRWPPEDVMRGACQAVLQGRT